MLWIHADSLDACSTIHSDYGKLLSYLMVNGIESHHGRPIMAEISVKDAIRLTHDYCSEIRGIMVVGQGLWHKSLGSVQTNIIHGGVATLVGEILANFGVSRAHWEIQLSERGFTLWLNDEVLLYDNDDEEEDSAMQRPPQLNRV